ncbi:hypothetical protein O1611_g10339 [Lasiodiplodia mahajangana]|uniref:Uncharacterized protein n=1 Tax=Lasiodiplodia mahajangana TaxID=1108764 RepID=A0ACC2IZF5_9PEZI|nr:hypothetical protein O1611_g10339 [Lasiodiplodia mahajangana]
MRESSTEAAPEQGNDGEASSRMMRVASKDLRLDKERAVESPNTPEPTTMIERVKRDSDVWTKPYTSRSLHEISVEDVGSRPRYSNFPSGIKPGVGILASPKEKTIVEAEELNVNFHGAVIWKLKDAIFSFEGSSKVALKVDFESKDFIHAANGSTLSNSMAWSGSIGTEEKYLLNVAFCSFCLAGLDYELALACWVWNNFTLDENIVIPRISQDAHTRLGVYTINLSGLLDRSLVVRKGLMKSQRTQTQNNRICNRTRDVTEELHRIVAKELKVKYSTGLGKAPGVAVYDDTYLEPPIGWTDEIDNDEYWGPEGTIWTLLIVAGIESTGMKPLYTREAWAGSCITLLQSGASPNYYFHTAIDDFITYAAIWWPDPKTHDAL